MLAALPNILTTNPLALPTAVPPNLEAIAVPPLLRRPPALLRPALPTLSNPRPALLTIPPAR